MFNSLNMLFISNKPCQCRNIDYYYLRIQGWILVKIIFLISEDSTLKKNHICSVMFSMLVSSAVDDLFSDRDWVKPKTIQLVFIAGPLSMQHYGVRAKTGWLRIRKKCIRVVWHFYPWTVVFSELALKIFNSVCWSSTKQTSSSSHQAAMCSRHDMAEKLLIWCWAILTHSSTPLTK